MENHAASIQYILHLLLQQNTRLTRFEPRIFGVGSVCSASSATVTVPSFDNLILNEIAS